MSQDVLRGLQKLFGSERRSDCEITFCRDESAPIADGSAASEAVFGPPLPAHSVVLELASERFRTQFERWEPVSATAGRRPQLRIPLGSAAEVPAARAAIRFAYTGEVPTDSSVRQVLELRRQGAYLQISGCVAACDEVLTAKVSSSSRAAVASSHMKNGSNKRARTSEEAPQQPPAVLELFESEVLWPDPQAEPAFGAILATGKRSLVAHFGNSLAALNTHSLREQLLALPAVALEALLESDEFGTDDEASVLLMLAMWMRINRDKAEPAVRQRLCRTVRLVHLSRPYLSLILPALAADHEKDPEAPAGWFSGADALEATAVANFASAAAKEKQMVLWAAEELPAVSGLLRVRPRPQCIPPSGGLTFSWHIPKEHLLQTVRQLQPGSVQRVYGAFDHQPHLAWYLQHGVFAWGFEWCVFIQVTGGQSTAGVLMHCDLPTALTPPGSRLSREGTLTRITTVPISASLVVHRRQGAAARNVQKTCTSDVFVNVGTARGWFKMLPLQNRQQQDAMGNTAAAVTVAADPLAAWVEYLTDGKVSGTLTLLRPSP
ncbi:hypothetical protein PLESTB_000222100 [Pleodorina starrii]|uniref:BTB domain-containing protein n=1 Tax=Pleodorina starrii TaxID=330485 RepID=A0A9W6BC71_9CHLO|nr:hypothetical protein PLESTM_001547800 [Pleodorina starrii]GLC49466.1 hypothetical protein PLESTB_000222100 [Pleodorina starrii]GLC75700.1 hypothetical protein PLESTF_001675200 [Pleodorina starrii]